MSILVLGVGNVLLTDEGIGVRTVETLLEEYRFSDNVEVVDGGTAGMELVEIIANQDHVILIDAVNTGADVGTVVTLEDEEVPALFRSRISPHQLGISDLLGVMALTGETPKNFTLFGVVPFSMATGVELSPEMLPLKDILVKNVINKLEALGCTVTKERSALTTKQVA
jgi:hydrogenase maturation protease